MLSRLPTRCKQCKAKFSDEDRALHRRIHPDCIPAYAEAQQAKAQRKAEKLAIVAAKVDRALDRAKRAELKTIAQLIAAAQVSFNAFIRERDKDKGCFVCSRPFMDKPGRVQHAGHVRSRGAAGHLRFAEDNCMGECEGCNGPHGAKPHQIKAGAIARIGAARFEELENDNTPRKWRRDELIAIKAEFVQRLKQLKGAMQ